MGISVTTGIASGIDYEEIIEATLAVEEEKIEKYETKLEDYNTEISALGEVKSALSTMQSAMKDLGDSWDFFEYSASSTNEDILTATTTGDAAVGTYNIEVSQMALPEIIIGGGGFSDKTDTVGGGTISIAVGSGDAVDVEIASDSTLIEIRNAINNSDAGVTASIMKVSDGSYALALTANENGQSITFSIDDDDSVDDDDSGLSALYADPSTGSMNVAQEGALAKYSLGTVEFESSSNEIDGLIEGVTLTLNSAEVGKTVTVKVATDTEATGDKVQAFVDAYNDLIELLDEYQDKGDEESYGILFGDTTTNNMRARLRSILFTQVENGESGITYLSQLGVQMQDDKTLTFDQDTFEEALADDPEGVMTFFTASDTGFADVMNNTLKGYVSWDGILAAKIDGLESSATRTQSKIDSLEDKLDVFETRLRAKYAALETLLSELTNTQSSLTSLLDSLASTSS